MIAPLRGRSTGHLARRSVAAIAVATVALAGAVPSGAVASTTSPTSSKAPHTSGSVPTDHVRRDATRRTPALRTHRAARSHASSTRSPLKSRAAVPIVVRALPADTTGTLQGTVTDTVSAAPLAGVCLYLYQGSAYAGGTACTGGAGTYSITDVPAGSYTVAVSDPRHSTPRLGMATPLTRQQRPPSQSLPVPLLPVSILA